MTPTDVQYYGLRCLWDRRLTNLYAGPTGIAKIPMLHQRTRLAAFDEPPREERFYFLTINCDSLLQQLDKWLDDFFYHNPPSPLGQEIQVIIGGDLLSQYLVNPLPADEMSRVQYLFYFDQHPIVLLGNAKGLLIAPLPPGLQNKSRR